MAAIVLTAAASSTASWLGASAFMAGVAGGVGGYLGGFIDQSIFGKKGNINKEGSRMTDLMVQVSTYGKPIPIVYGSARIAGNIIWSRPIEEHITTSTQNSGGGKGGGGRVTTASTHYSYTASFAVSICEGEITEVIRVWADGKQLDFSKGNYTLYLGSEAQQADSFISSFIENGKSPAYRGMAYVVIKDLPLGNFGNRIPNFTFEIQRTMKKLNDLEDKIKEITLIPGAGEYVYDTIIQEKSFGVIDDEGNFIQRGKARKLNVNNPNNKANVLLALDNLKTTLPNIEWVSVVVNWFMDSVNPLSCTIKPGVEYNDQSSRVRPDEWQVGNFNRINAHQILLFPNEVPTYGGSPTDKSLIRLCSELKSRGYKVLLYPMLQVDTITPQCKPWRGRITADSVDAVIQFFTKSFGYNNFIRHYAELLQNSIDAFIIGSELVGLTQYMNPVGVFPAVDQLKNLAASIKAILQNSAKVIYSGDWSEYHSVNGWYNLDPLWGDPNIDIVAIDCYFPLTEDLPQSQINYQKVYEGWTKGEGWDYYYMDSIKRSGKTPYSSHNYAWKDVKHWWSNYHINPDSSTTPWVPKMKPIWFAELGFPSVDCAPNQPNVFVDPTSIENFFPRVSRGRVDFAAQRIALEASIDFINDQNNIDPDFIPRKFIWTWDARPFPYWPDYQKVWADSANWKTGHWVQGKLGLSNLGQVIANLLKKVGYDSSMYDVSRLDNIVTGYIITHRQTVRECLEQLGAAYFFDMVESDGLLKFNKKGKPPTEKIDFTELVVNENACEALTITRTQELELPKQVDIIYINRSIDYQTSTQISQRQTVSAVDCMTVNLPMVFTDQEAKVIADVTLYNAWVSRVQYHFILPTKYTLLEPTDVITIIKDNTPHTMRLIATKLMRNGMQEVSAVREDISSYDFYNPAGYNMSDVEMTSTASETEVILLDLPALPTDNMSDAYMRYGVVGLGDDWKGASIYRSDDNGANYSLIKTFAGQSTVGAVINAIPVGTIYTWDETSTIDVALIFGELQSVTDIAVLNGANICIIGDEIIQFQSAVLIDTNQYRLSRLLRGRLGTEWAVNNHKAGERFILLTNALNRESMPSSSFGIIKKYKAVSIDSTLDAASCDFTYSARALKPYALVHVRGTRTDSNDLIIKWKRRTRIGGDWRDFVDIPLFEAEELYEVDIMDGTFVKRSFINLAALQVIYTREEQLEDFEKIPNKITINVYQISAIVGRGYPATIVI